MVYALYLIETTDEKKSCEPPMKMEVCLEYN
jgi:hypothetical protein